MASKTPSPSEHPSKILHRARRRKSVTLRAQYINTKELRVSVGTWNVAGKLSSDDLEISDWLNVDEPADIYYGHQEPLSLSPNPKRISLPQFPFILMVYLPKFFVVRED